MSATIDNDGIAHLVVLADQKSIMDNTTSATYDYYTEAKSPNLLKNSQTGWRRSRMKKDGTEFVFARTGAAGTETDGYVFPGPTGSPTLTAQVYGED